MRFFTTLGNGIAALKRTERPMPVPESDAILVKMTAAALNYLDLQVINGKGTWKPLAERIPVSDGVGVVAAVGDKVGRFNTGDRVAGIFNPKWLDSDLTAEKAVGSLGGAAADGVMSEYCVFNEQAAVAVPSHLTDVEAATLPDSGVTEEEVLTLTNGRGVDHVIEVVGGKNLNRSLRAVKISGTISFIGALAGLSVPINTLEIAAKNAHIHGIDTGSREMFEEMNRFITSHQLKPVIDKIYAFAEFPEALNYLESGKHFGKVTVVF